MDEREPIQGAGGRTAEGHAGPPPNRTAAPGHPVILYDGSCPICRAAAPRLLALARRGAEAVSIHDPTVPSRFPGLPAHDLAKAMHAVLPDGRVYRGVEAVARLAATRRFPGLMAHVYYVPGLRQLLDLIYAWVARNRHRLRGGRGGCDAGACGADPPRR